MPPLISVIIACRNPGPRLARAVESVRMQDFSAHEIVVIDGASSDGTREWLSANAGSLGTVVSEPDGGVYEAMNKGVARAKGEWVLFLGADDELAGSSVLKRAAALLDPGAGDVFAGEARFDDGRIYRFAGAGAAVRRNFVHHQAAFYRRTLFARLGGFDGGLRVQADYDFNLRLMRAGCRFQSLPLRVAECASGGLSDQGSWQNYREEIAVRHRHFGSVRSAAWDAGSVVRCFRKKILGAVKHHA
jgi:putative colanic acid biosynthesis glycosyltransferase